MKAKHSRVAAVGLFERRRETLLLDARAVRRIVRILGLSRATPDVSVVVLREQAPKQVGVGFADATGDVGALLIEPCGAVPVRVRIVRLLADGCVVAARQARLELALLRLIARFAASRAASGTSGTSGLVGGCALGTVGTIDERHVLDAPAESRRHAPDVATLHLVLEVTHIVVKLRVDGFEIVPSRVVRRKGVAMHGVMVRRVRVVGED
mmetsp:Transcript_6405/g.21409  ORF Transcript_6405/g.21409 Transcript_6405/m.21409 type:complete len:210 (+) Transcript_6405:215-844(+)